MTPKPTATSRIAVPAPRPTPTPGPAQAPARIAVSEPDIGVLEERYAGDAVRSGWISSIGPYVGRFEQDFSRFCDSRFAAACANGTCAVHLALAALGVGEGDEVIVPTLTFIASANAVRYCGATPVLVDVAPDTWCLDVTATAAAITPRTRAVVAVHLYGHPADVPALRRLCDPLGIAVVEDAAEAHGARLNGQPVGSLGTIAAFSFFGNKILTTGEGGMVTTDDPELDSRVRLLRGQGMSPDRRYWFPEVGYNYRLTNVASAIGVAQLERAADLLARRQQVADRYEAWFADRDDVGTPVTRPGAERVPWCYTVTLPDDPAGATRDAVAGAMTEAGIETRPSFIPLHLMPPYRSTTPHPVAERIGRQGLSLPTHPRLTAADVDRVASTLLRALDQHALDQHALDQHALDQHALDQHREHRA